MLSAEMWSKGLWNYEDDCEINFAETTLSENTQNAIIIWTKEYEPYTSSQNTTDNNILNKVKELDVKGIQLLKQISIEWNILEIKKYYYYSVVEDKLKYVLYKDGSERCF